MRRPSIEEILGEFAALPASTVLHGVPYLIGRYKRRKLGYGPCSETTKFITIMQIAPKMAKEEENMPTVRVNDIDMYYEIHGEGEPVVLIAGLNSDHSLYRGILPQLAERYQVIIFDNRGVGQTDKPDIPYSIEMMAEDTAGLLNTLGITQAHILGTSMGGRIAVALALEHPQPVKSLILVSTGVKRSTRMTWSRLRISLMLRIPAVRGSNPYYAVVRQLEASRAYDCMDRLREIQVPTLILHGKKDKTAPYRLAEEMHRGIKGSKMIAFNGGHLFFILRSKQFLKAITDFLDHVSS
jgi:3-oxoadipate enol-lactonase